jgi:hypothetical protein
MNELHKHEAALIDTEVEQLIYFSRTYAIMNRNIDIACRDGCFLNSELICKLQLHFALLYFETLNNYATTGSLPMQWARASNNKTAPFMPAGLSLFFAINAHVALDAPKALHSLNVEPHLISREYTLINKIILGSSQEVVNSYNPNPWLRLARELARKALIRPICAVIFKWRKTSWLEYSNAYNTGYEGSLNNCTNTVIARAEARY